MKLSKQEKEIAESVERGDWRSVRGVKKQIKRYQEYAKATVRKDKRVNIRMSEKDLEILLRWMRHRWYKPGQPAEANEEP